MRIWRRLWSICGFVRSLKIPSKKGLNLIIKDPQGKIDRTRRVSLELHDIPASDVVKLLAKLFDVTVKIEPYAILFSPKDDDKEMWPRTFKVPPDFLRTSLK